MSELAEVRIALRDAVEGDIVRIGAVTFDVTHSSSTDEAMHLSKFGVVKAFLWHDLEWLGAEAYREAPELPQGLGAVIKLTNGLRYVRAEDAVGERWQWRCADSGHGWLSHACVWLSHACVVKAGFTVLSPGIVTAGGEEA